MLLKSLAAVSCLALLTAGCVVVDNDPPQDTVYYGTLTTNWTLDGSNDPSICTYYGVDVLDYVVYDDRGNVLYTEQPFCEDFSITIDVPDGVYTAEVTLLDYGGAPLSDTVGIEVDVYRDDITVIELDFPDASIY